MRRLASVVLTGALLTACGGNPFSPEGVSGVYNLVSVNGNALPWSEPGGIPYHAGSISLNANSTYSASLDIGNPGGAVTASGTFELVEPATIRFTPNAGGGPFFSSGTLDGNRLTIIDGDSFVYEK